MPVRRILAALATALTVIAASASVAYADTVTNNVTVGGNDTTTVGVATTVGFTLNATHDSTDPGNSSQCNAKTAAPVTVAVNVPSGSGVTATPSAVNFRDCTTAQTVQLVGSKIGDYSISMTAPNGSGVDTSAAKFTLHIKTSDTTPPVLTLPANMTVEATSGAGSQVSYTATAFDAQDNAATPVVCSPASGTTFPLGTTTVSCSSKDSAGNTATGTFTVTVRDTTGPVLTLSDQSAEATSSAGAQVGFSATAADAVDGPVAVTCTPASGSTFALGTTTVTCSAKDSRNNTTNGTLKVTVKDTTAPALTLPTTTVAEATSGGGTTVTYTASATDLVDGARPVSCDHASGSTFALGTTTVTCTASDTRNNTVTGTFAVTVGDTTAPTLNLTNTTVEATGPDGATAAYQAGATDAVDGTRPVDCTPGSGTQFALGTTTVHCSASDTRGNTAMGDLTVTVKDSTAPSLVLSDQTVEATSGAGAAVNFAASATDLVDGTVTASCSKESGATFPLGATTVTCEATDRAGNKGSGSFTVKVQDKTAPTLKLSNQSQEATGADGAKVTFSPAPSATDVVDGSDDVACTPASGSTFPLGLTTVTCSSNDSAGNRAESTLTVTVADTTPPSINASSVTAEATGPGGAQVFFAPTAFDIVDGAVPVACNGPSTGVYPLGDTTVTCSAEDSHHNFNQVQVTITVTDTTPPAITTTDATAEATGPDGAIVTYSASATDLVDGTVPVVCTPDSKSTFPLGRTTVSCTATDAHGNPAKATATVTVQDTTGPVLSLADQTIEATGPDGAPATFSPTAHDVVSGDVAVACEQNSGATFPIGTTTVKCAAKDGAGNTSDGSFTVTVGDHTAPELTLKDAEAEATGPQGAVVNYDAGAVDIVDGLRAVDCSPASGGMFPIAVTTVSCSSSDTRGNTAKGALMVTVHDNTPPAVTVTDQQAEATGPDGAAVTYSATATDIVDGNVAVSCDRETGSTFPVGTTTVKCTATDAHANVGRASFTVTVSDTTAPALNLPSNQTIEATSGAGAKVTFTATATDLVDGPTAVTCGPASGDTFPLGTTTVSCATADKAGNPSSGSFMVTVQDTTAPKVTVPSGLTAEATGPGGAAVTYSATAADIVDGSRSVTCAPASGATFALGDTVVSCSSSDRAGNTGSAQFTVTVQDKTAPTLTKPADISLTATSAAGAVATYSPTATDAVSGTVAAICTPKSGSTFALGTTIVSCTATDQAGNTSNAQTFAVNVTAPWSGVLAPLNANGTSVYKIGSTIPVKFQLTGSAAGVSNLVAKIYYAKVSNNLPGTEVEATSTSGADTGNQFRYDSSGNQYIFNLSTKGFTEGTYQLRIDLGDGVPHTVNITSRK